MNQEQKEFSGYRQMHRSMGESLQHYSIAEIEGLITVLRENVKGPIINGAIAYLEDIASAKREKAEIADRHRLATQHLLNRIYRRGGHVSLHIL